MSGRNPAEIPKDADVLSNEALKKRLDAENKGHDVGENTVLDSKKYLRKRDKVNFEALAEAKKLRNEAAKLEVALDTLHTALVHGSNPTELDAFEQAREELQSDISELNASELEERVDRLKFIQSKFSGDAQREDSSKKVIRSESANPSEREETAPAAAEKLADNSAVSEKHSAQNTESSPAAVKLPSDLELPLAQLSSSRKAERDKFRNDAFQSVKEFRNEMLTAVKKEGYATVSEAPEWENIRASTSALNKLLEQHELARTKNDRAEVESELPRALEKLHSARNRLASSLEAKRNERGKNEPAAEAEQKPPEANAESAEQKPSFTEDEMKEIKAERAEIVAKREAMQKAEEEYTKNRIALEEHKSGGFGMIKNLLGYNKFYNDEADKSKRVYDTARHNYYKMRGNRFEKRFLNKAGSENRAEHLNDLRAAYGQDALNHYKSVRAEANYASLEASERDAFNKTRDLTWGKYRQLSFAKKASLAVLRSAGYAAVFGSAVAIPAAAFYGGLRYFVGAGAGLAAGSLAYKMYGRAFGGRAEAKALEAERGAKHKFEYNADAFDRMEREFDRGETIRKWHEYKKKGVALGVGAAAGGGTAMNFDSISDTVRGAHAAVLDRDINLTRGTEEATLTDRSAVREALAEQGENTEMAGIEQTAQLSETAVETAESPDPLASRPDASSLDMFPSTLLRYGDWGSGPEAGEFTVKDGDSVTSLLKDYFEDKYPHLESTQHTNMAAEVVDDLSRLSDEQLQELGFTGEDPSIHRLYEENTIDLRPYLQDPDYVNDLVENAKELSAEQINAIESYGNVPEYTPEPSPEKPSIADLQEGRIPAIKSFDLLPPETAEAPQVFMDPKVATAYVVNEPNNEISFVVAGGDAGEKLKIAENLAKESNSSVFVPAESIFGSDQYVHPDGTRTVGSAAGEADNSGHQWNVVPKDHLPTFDEVKKQIIGKVKM